MKLRFSRYLFVAVFSVAAVAVSAPASAERDDQDEFAFMSQLVDWGFSDYAEKALDKLLLKQPNLKDRAKVIQAKILVSKGKLNEAEELARSLPQNTDNARAIKLSLAKGFDNRGQTDKAQKLYDDFFNEYRGRKPSDPLLLEMVKLEAFEYAKRMERSSEYAKALEAYDLAMSVADDDGVIRGMKAEKANALLEMARSGDTSRIDEIHKLGEELSWVVDIPFGQAAVVRAHAYLLQNKKNEALALIKENQTILKQLDDAVKEAGLSLSLSPWAGARFLRGEVYERDAKAMAAAGNTAGAIKSYGKSINEFFNVYQKYAGTDWASKAGLKAQEVKDILEEEFGKTVKVDLGDFQAVAGPDAFRNGDNLYGKKQYAEALNEYLNVLNQYPESEETPRVLANIVRCFANLGDDLMVKATCAYAGERFGHIPDAGKVLLLAGAHYYKQQNEEMYTYLFESFVDYFPASEKAGGVLLNLAAFRQKAGDMQGRMKFLKRIFEDYKDDQAYLKALWMLGWEVYKKEEFDQAAGYFAQYVEAAQPGPEKAKAQFALADIYSRQKEYANAVKAFQEIVVWLDPGETANAFNTSAEARKENEQTYEKARFQVANNLSILKLPGDKQAAIKQKALESFDSFLQDFPRSDLASKAMAGKGRLLLGMGRFDEATATFNKLSSTYPDTAEGQSANFSLIKAAIESGKLEIARDAFKNMMANKGSFSHLEFYNVGKLFQESSLHAEAVQAFTEVQNNTDEKVYVQRALLGIGQAQFAQKNYAKTIPPLEELLERYPRSALFFDAKFTLAECFIQTERFDEGKEVLAEILKRAEKPLLKNRAGLILGDLQLKEGEIEAAYASFQRVSLLADPGEPSLRPIIEEALVKGIEVASSLERWNDVVENCDQYLNEFPAGKNVEKVRSTRRAAKLKAVDGAP